MKTLITGVNSILNKALLAKLASYDIVAHYHTNNSLSEGLKKKYPEVIFIQADFSEKASFENFYQQALKLGPYDVLINGAVLYAESDKLTDNWKETQKRWNSWQNSFATNTIVPGLLLANADKLLKNGGVVINISSANGQPQFGDVQFAIYSATKGALDSLTDTYAKRWSPRIRIAGIAPGYVHSAWNLDLSEKEKSNLAKAHLTHKLIEPNDIAQLMMTIINNPGINATTILIDGEYSAPIK